MGTESLTGCFVASPDLSASPSRSPSGHPEGHSLARFVRLLRQREFRANKVWFTLVPPQRVVESPLQVRPSVDRLATNRWLNQSNVGFPPSFTLRVIHERVFAVP